MSETSEAASDNGHPRPNGVLLLDKPSGLTSNAALQKVRRLFWRVKAGHTGTLDPLASGLLPICLGEATKFSHPLLEARKAYLATLRLGWHSSTGDSEGELSAVAAPDFDEQALNRAIDALTGAVEQVPPMYSAIKVKGRPLYSLARKGINVERDARRVHIYQLDVLRRSGETLEIFALCSKGTYIRVLAEDLGEQLGCGAYLAGLRRVSIGALQISDAVGFEWLEFASMSERLALLQPLDLLLEDVRPLRLNEHNSRQLCHGLAIPGYADIAPLERARIYTKDGRFLGLGEVDEAGLLKPKRLISKAF
ncbi:MAG: tRNA pseudouridine(55) synthase TruB [Betaproteobacteria bacterium]|nr:MAG: tRNA pseudouridine(55) synthase TruB [Betaproteobacteria bacterium]